MKDAVSIVKDQLKHLSMILRIARYEERADYQSHYLGLLWQILNPLIQIGTYYLIFGVGLRGTRTATDGVPFFVWMVVGMTTWMFINQSITRGSKAIVNKVNLVSKMKFPLNILPSINIASGFSLYLVMLVVSLILLASQGVTPTLMWAQYIYYFICMIVFLYAVTLFTSTITVLFRDMQFVIQSVMRLLFYVSGTIWNIAEMPESIRHYFSLNPILYIVEGFRDAFLSRAWFWESPELTIYFWAFTLFFLVAGSVLHNKFKESFVDYV